MLKCLAMPHATTAENLHSKGETLQEEFDAPSAVATMAF